MVEWKLLLTILGVFTYLSFQAVGGGPAVLPEMKLVTNDAFHLSSEQFVQAYGLGQLVPGPNMLLVVVLGYRVAGIAGALIALIAFFVPMSIIVLRVGRRLRNLKPSPWKNAVRDGIAPITIGLMAAGAYAMGLSATTTLPTIALALVVIAFMLKTKVNPVWLVLGCAVFGALFLPRS